MSKPVINFEYTRREPVKLGSLTVTPMRASVYCRLDNATLADVEALIDDLHEALNWHHAGGCVTLEPS